MLFHHLPARHSKRYYNYFFFAIDKSIHCFIFHIISHASIFSNVLVSQRDFLSYPRIKLFYYYFSSLHIFLFRCYFGNLSPTTRKRALLSRKEWFFWNFSSFFSPLLTPYEISRALVVDVWWWLWWWCGYAMCGHNKWL